MGASIKGRQPAITRGAFSSPLVARHFFIFSSSFMVIY